MGNKIPTQCENIFYFMPRNYIILKIDGGTRRIEHSAKSKEDHESTKQKKHEKLAANYHKIFGRRHQSADPPASPVRLACLAGGRALVPPKGGRMAGRLRRLRRF